MNFLTSFNIQNESSVLYIASSLLVAKEKVESFPRLRLVQDKTIPAPAPSLGSCSKILYSGISPTEGAEEYYHAPSSDIDSGEDYQDSFAFSDGYGGSDLVERKPESQKLTPPPQLPEENIVHRLNANNVGRDEGDRPFKCETCGNSFKQRGHLRDHIRLHTGERPFKCNFCERTFTQRSGLRSHVLGTHFPKAFKCLMCDKTFGHLSSLEDHTRAHTGERPYSCDLCDGSFETSSKLLYHRTIHAGLAPHEKCEICQKRFATSEKLIKHTRRNHRKVGQCPWTCSTCDRSFKSLKSLNDHNQVHTGEKPYNCASCGKSFRFISN